MSDPIDRPALARGLVNGLIIEAVAAGLLVLLCKLAAAWLS